MCSSSKCQKCTACSLMTLGIFLLVAGIILAALGSLKSLVDDKIKERLPLKPGSKSYNKWQKPDDRLREYYIFNITNSDISSGGVPKLKQLGPYTYRQVISNNVTNTENGILTYIPNKRYIFDKARSCQNCNPLEDKIITINYPVLILTRVLSYKLNGSVAKADRITKIFTNNGIGIFQKRSVHELLWGYIDVTFAKRAERLLRTNVLSLYALQVNNSGSESEEAKIYSGEDDVVRVGEYVEWSGFRNLSWWNSERAKQINGTDGGRFSPSVNKDDELYIFVTEICRSVKLVYDATVDLDGIDLYRFTLPKEEFESGDINSNNKGFCVTGPQKKCLPSGLQDINVCKGGAKGPPVVASLPHFYLGVSNLSKIFDMNPVKAQDETYLDIEKNTGLSMRFHKRLQVNMAVSSFSIHNLLLNINTSNPIFQPVFYLDESAVISDEDADDFKQKVLLPLRVTEIVPYAMIGLGALLILIALIIMVVLCRKRGSSKRGGEHWSLTQTVPLEHL